MTAPLRTDLDPEIDGDERPPVATAPPHFRLLHDEHRSRVRSRLGQLGVAEEALDDATQEVFAVAHRRLPGAESPTAAAAWLNGVTRRVASRYRRTLWRRRRKHAELGPAPSGGDAARWDTLLELERAMARLDPEVRVVYRLVELEGHAAGDVAAALDLARTTVYGRLAKARRELRGTYADLGVEPSRRSAGWFLFLVPLRGAAAALAGFGWLGGFAFGALVGAAILIVALPAPPPPPEAYTPASAPAEPSPRRSPRGKSVAAAPHDPPAPARSSPEPTPAEPTAPPPRRARGKRPAPGDPRPASADRTPTLTAELALLRAGRAALRRGDPDAALQHLRRHELQFPNGALADARTATVVQALCAQGRRANARAEATRLRRRVGPTSPLLPRGDPCEVPTANAKRSGD